VKHEFRIISDRFIFLIVMDYFLGETDRVDSFRVHFRMNKVINLSFENIIWFQQFFSLACYTSSYFFLSTNSTVNLKLTFIAQNLTQLWMVLSCWFVYQVYYQKIQFYEETAGSCSSHCLYGCTCLSYKF
jgi:vacuolar-type H+-ATPase subunit I/STV1